MERLAVSRAPALGDAEALALDELANTPAEAHVQLPSMLYASSDPLAEALQRALQTAAGSLPSPTLGNAAWTQPCDAPHGLAR